MKLKTYFVSALVLASTLIGFTPSTKAQDSNTRAISCNGCIESTKRQVVKDIIAYGYAQGQYRFVVINMEGGNVHEYDVNVPPQYIDDFGQSSQQPTITLIYRADQALRNQRVRDVKEAMEDINTTINNSVVNPIPMPDNSNYASAYNALEYKIEFSRYLNYLLSDTETISERTYEGTLLILQMAEDLDISLPRSSSIALALNEPVKAWIIFADGSKLKVYLELTLESGSGGIEISITVTDVALDKNGDIIPLNVLELAPYNFGHSEINASALQSYFNSIGFSIIYGNWSGGESNCATKWKCNSNGKTCELIVITDSC